MSNELHDLAARRAAEMGFAADHARAGVDAGAESLFEVVLNNAFAGRPPLAESGYRIWIMAARCCVPVPVAAAADRRAMRDIATRCNGGLRVPQATNARAVFELVRGDADSAWLLGRRASLLAYALSRNVIIREALPSFEVIGELWRLRATNKRSAVCAAMNKLREELVRCGQLPRTFRFWFEKSADAKLVYAQAQAGNTNRAGGGEAEAEMPAVETELFEGVPVKPQWAALTPQQVRRALNRLHEASEMKRLLGDQKNTNNEGNNER